MSRYIKSAETLKARVGKQVKVDGERFDVSYEDETVKLKNDTQIYEIADTPVAIGKFLRSHDVATAGYKFKHASKVVKDFILDKECRITLSPYTGNFDDSSSHTIVGMLRFCKDHLGDKGYMLLTNDGHLRGDPAEDMKGYDWSWWLGFDENKLKEYVEKTEPLESEKTESDPAEKEYSLLQYMGDETTRKTVKGVIRYYNDISYLLSNNEDFNGGHPDVVKGTGYKYGWWLCTGTDISKSKYAIREVSEESKCAESDKTTTDPLVRIAMALERIAVALEK